MDASIEMKAGALEKVIETQKQLAKMKNNLGIIIEPLDDLIHIASTDDFMAYAKHFEEQILIGDAAPFEKDEITKLKFLSFMHMDFKIYTYAIADEMKKYFRKDAVEDHE